MRNSDLPSISTQLARELHTFLRFLKNESGKYRICVTLIILEGGFNRTFVSVVLHHFVSYNVQAFCID